MTLHPTELIIKTESLSYVLEEGEEEVSTPVYSEANPKDKKGSQQRYGMSLAEERNGKDVMVLWVPLRKEKN